MEKYWYGKTIDKNVSEKESKWQDVCQNLTSLSFYNNGQRIHLPDNKEYVQGKTGSWTSGNKDSIVESRFIGYKDRNNTIKVRIIELTNDIRIEINNVSPAD